MITEDFCSFGVAKLLKEKGFNEGCNSYFISDNEIALISNRRDFNNHGVYLSAPTHQMAMKWLREVHKLAFIISPQWAEGDMRNPCRWYWEIRGLEDIGLDVYSNPLCNTYEEAVEAAIKYSLENLI